MPFVRRLIPLMRLLALVLVVLGIGFWTGHWYELLAVHRALGVVFVISLWTIAVAALVERRATGLAIGTIVWGLVIVGLGMSQQRILTGDLHWIVRLTHLATAVVAMQLAERLVRNPAPR